MSPRPSLVIGLGTGRSGSESLARLLDAQEGATCSHEGHLLPWLFDEEALETALAALCAGGGRPAGDVGMYWLPYVKAVLARHPGARFICLERDRARVVESFLEKSHAKNHWCQDAKGWRPDPVWDPCFPKYPTTDKRAAIGMYWDEYREKAATLAAELPGSFRVWPMESALNDEAGQRDLLAFAGVPAHEATLRVGVVVNRQLLKRRLRHAWRRLIGLEK